MDHSINAVAERPRWGAVRQRLSKGIFMNNLVYIVGAIVIVVAILGFLGLR